MGLRTLVMKLIADSKPFEEGLNKASKSAQSFTQKMKKQFGEESGLGNFGKVLKGAGVVAGVAAVAQVTERSTKAMLDLNTQWQAGVSGAKVFQSALADIPIIGNLFKTGENLGQLFAQWMDPKYLLANEDYRAAIDKRMKYASAAIIAHYRGFDRQRVALQEKQKEELRQLADEALKNPYMQANEDANMVAVKQRHKDETAELTRNIKEQERTFRLSIEREANISAARGPEKVRLELAAKLADRLKSIQQANLDGLLSGGEARHMADLAKLANRNEMKEARRDFERNAREYLDGMGTAAKVAQANSPEIVRLKAAEQLRRTLDDISQRQHNGLLTQDQANSAQASAREVYRGSLLGPMRQAVEQLQLQNKQMELRRGFGAWNATQTLKGNAVEQEQWAKRIQQAEDELQARQVKESVMNPVERYERDRKEMEAVFQNSNVLNEAEKNRARRNLEGNVWSALNLRTGIGVNNSGMGIQRWGAADRTEVLLSTMNGELKKIADNTNPRNGGMRK